MHRQLILSICNIKRIIGVTAGYQQLSYANRTDRLKTTLLMLLDFIDSTLNIMQEQKGNQPLKV